MKYTLIHKIEEYNGTIFLGEDPFQVFNNHLRWIEEKKRYILRELHSGHGEIMNSEYDTIHETDQILYNRILYFRPLTKYGAALLYTLIYELIPGLTIKNFNKSFVCDCWYKLIPHYTCWETFTSDYAMLYEYYRNTEQYNEIDECDAHILKTINSFNSKGSDNT